MSEFRPNVLYLHSHDTGRYIQPYGHAIETPRLQMLAEEGVLFRKVFCAAPTCSASRASMLTGMWSHNNGMLGLQHRGFSLTDPSRTLMHTLRSAGYHTAIGGINHISDDAEEIGFDRVIEKRSRAEFLAPAAAAYLQGSPRGPFFLSVGFFETHREFPTPEAQDDARYTLPPVPLPDTPETRSDMAAFKASARVLDRGIGVVLDALEAAGLAENTLVMYGTDHGIPFPGMKANLTDHGIGTALIARGPGGFTGGRVVDSMLSQVDLLPTLCEYLEIDIPKWAQGTSIMPVIRGEAPASREEVYAEVSYHAAYEPQRCVRTERWKYVRRFDNRQGPVLPNCDDSPSKTLWTENGWTERPRDQEMLFDLVFDATESCNVAGNPQYAEVCRKMRAKLDRWMRDTDDPLLRGPIQLPEGAVVTNADRASPGDV